MSLAAAAIQFLFSDSANVGDMPTTRRRRAARGIIITLIQTQVLFLAWGRCGLGYDDGLQRALQQFRVMDIGASDHSTQRAAIGFDHQATLYSVLTAIRWVLAHVIPPKRALPIAASADCHRQSRPPSSSQDLVNFLQIPCSTPLFTHRWK